MPGNSTIRVSIRARSPVVRAGIESLIRASASLEVIEEGREEMDADLGPDALVVEAESRKDPEALDALEEAANGVPVILLVRGPAAEWADALRQGVKAVLPSSVSGAQIGAAIEAVAAGLAVFDAAEMESMVAPARVQGGELLPETLTAREIEVLRAMAEGLANKEIAARLGISEHTVKFHVASVMGKLGAGSRTEAVTLGIRHGIVLI